MPYTLTIQGVLVQCETAEEALRLARLNADSNGTGPEGVSSSVGNIAEQPAGSRWTRQRITDFFNVINVNQRRFIDALLEQEEGLTEDQMFQYLGVKKNAMALAGITSALLKNAKKVGADPRDVFERKQVNIGETITYEYLLRDSFRRAAKGTKKETTKKD